MAEIKPIPADVNNEIAELASIALTLLKLDSASQPEAVVAAITDFVRDCKDKRSPIPDDEVFALGALLGSQYVRGLQWHWGSVVWDFDEQNGAIGVLNHDNSLFTNPVGWVDQVLKSDGGVPFMLSYNMIVANQTPVFEPDSATGLY
ncbi:hypothetical protein [Burkholderia sp. Ax-1719]|uniref:hypothetical protein n=1 Tax=Burkholderia sp. Ax-1719 TaxID=2608334 RepID=UPI0014215A1E|nr:hypothetical protein [Burkholderia sp. Ax-1719]NIE62707.1 hypothetical protein [Burkholderia sp. Ax-1719]